MNELRASGCLDAQIKLNEAIEVLRFLEPYLSADNVERSSLVRHSLRIILNEIENNEQEILGARPSQARETQ